MNRKIMPAVVMLAFSWLCLTTSEARSQTAEQIAQYQHALTVVYSLDACTANFDCQTNRELAEWFRSVALVARAACQNNFQIFQGDGFFNNGDIFYWNGRTLQSDALVLQQAGDYFLNDGESRWAAGDFNGAITATFLARGKYGDAITKYDAGSGAFAAAVVLYKLAKNAYNPPGLPA